MKATLKTMVLTAALVLGLTVLTSPTRADDLKTPPSPAVLMKALADAGKPGVEHKKLQPFVGDWTFTVRLWTDPSQPPAELRGTIERKWIMGDRFIQETVKGECNGQTFEGLGLLGYDNAQKKFTIVRACGFCGTASHHLATSNTSGTKFECATEECCPLSGEKVKGRDEIVIESNDKIVVNGYKTIGGKEVKAVEVVSIRKR